MEANQLLVWDYMKLARDWLNWELNNWWPTLGTRGFFSHVVDRNNSHGFGCQKAQHAWQSHEKTPGTEQFHSPFLLKFDQFYHSKNLSLWSNGLTRKDMTHSCDMTDQVWFEFMASAGLKAMLYSREKGSWFKVFAFIPLLWHQWCVQWWILHA